VTSHHDKIRKLCLLAYQGDPRAAVGMKHIGQSIDLDKTIRLRKGGDRARAFRDRKSRHPVLTGHERDKDEFFAAQFRGNPDRHLRIERLLGHGRQPGITGAT
jgi:hypothetical protein